MPKVHPDSLGRVGWNGRAEPFAICLVATRRRLAKGIEHRVRLNQRIRETARVRMNAGPTVLLGPLDQSGTNGIELDVAIHGERVCIGIDERRAKPALPERPRPRVPAIETGDIPVTYLLHRPRNRAVTISSDEKMYVVRHQDVGVNGDARVVACLPQIPQVSPAIVVVVEHRCAVDAAMRDVERKSWKFETRTSGHGCDSVGRGDLADQLAQIESAEGVRLGRTIAVSNVNFL